jgi:hypothetical protein
MQVISTVFTGKCLTSFLINCIHQLKEYDWSHALETVKTEGKKTVQGPVTLLVMSSVIKKSQQFKPDITRDML